MSSTIWLHTETLHWYMRPIHLKTVRIIFSLLLNYDSISVHSHTYCNESLQNPTQTFIPFTRPFFKCFLPSTAPSSIAVAAEAVFSAECKWRTHVSFEWTLVDDLSSLRIIFHAQLASGSATFIKDRVTQLTIRVVGSRRFYINFLKMHSSFLTSITVQWCSSRPSRQSSDPS